MIPYFGHEINTAYDFVPKTAIDEMGTKCQKRLISCPHRPRSYVNPARTTRTAETP